MMPSTNILCDADFLISLMVTNESTHQKALNIFEENSDCEFYILNTTKYETATVLSRKFEHNIAVQVLESINSAFPAEIWFHESWQSQVYDIYNAQIKKNISFFDCACLFTAQHFDFRIVSFDKFYPKEILLT